MKILQCGEKISPLCSPVPSMVAPPQQSIGVVMGPQQSGRTGLGAAKDDSIRKCSADERGGSSSVMVTRPWSCSLGIISSSRCGL